METVTINISEVVNKDFRRAAKESYGSRKGALSKAVSEALSAWVESKRQERLSKELLSLMEKEYDFGERLYKDRDELYF